VISQVDEKHKNTLMRIEGSLWMFSDGDWLTCVVHEFMTNVNNDESGDCNDVDE
jgi:hypothetical protein